MQKEPYLYSLTQVSHIESFCKEIYDVGMTHFGFINIYDKKSVRFSDRKDWIHSYFSKEFYNDYQMYQSVIDKLDYGEEHIEFVTNIPRSDHERLLINHGIWHLLLYFKRHKEYVEFWCYGAHPDNFQVLNYYINNLDHLKCFARNVQSKVSRLSEKPPPTGPFIKTSLLLPEVKNKQIIAYQDGNKISHVALTHKEIDCLALLRKGYPNKVIAKLLGNSPRTIEFHLTNIKNKFGVSYKSELLGKTQQMSLEKLPE